MDFKDELSERVKIVDEYMENFLPSDKYPKEIFEAMRYSVFAGGKRLRPIMVMEACNAFGGDWKDSMSFACAIEMIHTYSLIHDDLPALDNDDYRRGKLTTHKKYGEAMGILAGDALLNLAYETAFLAFDSKTDKQRIANALKVLGKKAGIYGMVGGQVVDVENNGKFVDEQMLHYVYKNKTSALIEASLMIGACLAGASQDEVRIMENVGTAIGLAFQIQDDILDISGDEKVIGKPVHSDEKNEKSTYPVLHGMEESRKKVAEYTDAGIAALDGITAADEEHKSFLRELLMSLVEREK